MRFNKSSNPVFGDKRIENIRSNVYTDFKPMTVQGTINKTMLLTGLVIISGYFSWNAFTANPAALYTLLGIGGIGGFIAALVTIIKPEVAKYSAPVYSILEGVFIGAISAAYAGVYNGIVIKAIGLTISILLIMFMAYKTGLLKATPKFRKGIIVATGGIMFFYILNLIASLFGGGFSLGSFGIIGIAIQLVIVGVAALNLILDFDNIEQGATKGMPEESEWYYSFGIMVTLIWLYLEILRLLSFISGD